MTEKIAIRVLIRNAVQIKNNDKLACSQPVAKK